ncbi:DUF4229 domain-containing protein [Tsukamurella sp. 1534]|uniref:DUF4229 domain-containing protein n=1 Tax=Tsukamurella sp. 1534 TaxID=1151061 RepID=UPI0009D9F94E|nr:DUF4229 domain-containing protein [Tsukamurella sp. 1534]
MTDSSPSASPQSGAPSDSEIGAAKRGLARDILLYTLFRLALVAVIVAVFYGIGRLITDEVPLIPVFLFAIVVALPLSMVVGKGLRDRVTRNAAVVDSKRKAERNDFRRRLQGMDE